MIWTLDKQHEICVCFLQVNIAKQRPDRCALPGGVILLHIIRDATDDVKMHYPDSRNVILVISPVCRDKGAKQSLRTVNLNLLQYNEKKNRKTSSGERKRRDDCVSCSARKALHCPFNLHRLTGVTHLKCMN